MKDLLEHIVRSLVDEPDQIEVHESDEDDSTLLELKVAPGDLGKVIGKQGRTARSIRTLLSVAGARQQKKVVFEILE